MTRRLRSNDLDGPQEPVQGPTREEDTSLAEQYPSGCLQITAQTDPVHWPTSLVQGSARHKAALINSACTPDLVIGADWSEPITFTDWLVMIRESADEATGEVRRYPWLSLICANGDIVGTSSAVVPHQLARLLRSYSEEEWAAGISVKFRRRSNRAGTRSYHEMRVCP